MAFELPHNRKEISDEDILQDMRRVAGLCDGAVRQQDYREHGKYGVTTAIRRFGSWAKANDKAGIEKSVDRKISEVDLMKNLLMIWNSLGRAPAYSEVAKPNSKYAVDTYVRRYGSWRQALQAFVSWANDSGAELSEGEHQKPEKRRTPRQPSARLIMMVKDRDRYTCRACGRSPANDIGTKLHVDHIFPWSKGGETELDNLQTLCQDCNLAKGDGTTRSK